MPANGGVEAAEKAVGEYQVEDEEEDDACGGEDIGGNVEADIERLACPGYAERESDNAGQAEADEDARGEELVAAGLVAHKDCQVEAGTGGK